MDEQALVCTRVCSICLSNTELNRSHCKALSLPTQKFAILPLRRGSGLNVSVEERKKKGKNERMKDQQVTDLTFILLKDWLGGTMPNVRFKLKPGTMTEG